MCTCRNLLIFKVKNCTPSSRFAAILYAYCLCWHHPPVESLWAEQQEPCVRRCRRSSAGWTRPRYGTLWSHWWWADEGNAGTSAPSSWRKRGKKVDGKQCFLHEFAYLQYVYLLYVCRAGHFSIREQHNYVILTQGAVYHCPGFDAGRCGHWQTGWIGFWPSPPVFL